MIVTYHNGRAVKVSVGNKCGNTTAIDVLGYPFHGFRARSGRAKLMKAGVYFRNEDLAPEDANIVARIAIVRDPVQRLASCYADRVLKKNRNGSRQYAPTWDHFVCNLEDIRKRSPDIRSHSRPQVAWTGTDNRIYTHVFTTKELSTKFTPLISQISGVEIPQSSRRKSSGGLSKTFEILPKHIEIIKDFYKEDYEVWGDYFQ